MYRHAKLYDSLQYSGYLAAKFQTWKESGVKKIKMLLVSMGISLSTSATPWELLPSDIKLDFMQKLLASDFSLKDIQYISCCRV
jgi:hypothetical protein